MIEYQPKQTDLHHCGACGAEVHTVAGARNVVCESCGHVIVSKAGGPLSQLWGTSWLPGFDQPFVVSLLQYRHHAGYDEYEMI